MADTLLPPGAALNLNLAQTARIPLESGMLNLEFTYSAPCGSVLLSTGSVGSSGSYVFEVDPQGVGKTWGHTSQFWQVGAGTDSMYSIWNPTALPQDLAVTIQYGAGGVYQYTLHLDAYASTMISIMDLIRSAKPDASGRAIPSSASMGSLSIGGIGPDMRNLVNFVMSSGTYYPTAGTCCQGYQTCNGATGCTVTQVSFTVAVGSDVNEVFMCSANGGGQTNYTGSANWNSSAPSIIAVTVGNAEGMEPGQSTIGAQISLPPYAPGYCGGIPCPPNGNFGSSASGTAAQITIISAAISQGSAGQIGVSLAPNGLSGGLSIAVQSDPQGMQNQHYIEQNQTRSSGNYTESFNRDTLPQNVEYKYIQASWNPSGAAGQALTVVYYHFNSLGVFQQTQYNTPAESQCTGSLESVYVFNNSCVIVGGNLISGFISRVTNPYGGTGSGYSSDYAGVFQEAYCSGRSTTSLRANQTITGTLGGLSNSTVAVNSSSILYKAVTRVFIEAQGVKSVTDRCGTNGCPDTSHLDNYNESQQCSGLTSLPSANTFDLYTDTTQ